MSAADDDLDALAGEYVLGTLDAAERHAVAVRLSTDAALRAAVDAWEARLLPLIELAAPAEPDAGLWSRIETRLPTAPGLQREPRVLAPPAWRAWWESLAVWRSLAGAGLAAALLLVVLPRAPTPAPRYVVVLVAADGQTPGWVVRADSTSRLSLEPLAPGSIPAHKAMQFWTKGVAWPAPVSLGLVTPGQAVQLPLDQLPPLQANQLFEITLEPEQGSPIGRPTGPVLFIGRAVRLQS